MGGIKVKCLAIADLFISRSAMEKGLQQLVENDIELTVREWKHENLEALQQDNLLIEQKGSEAVALPEELTQSIEDYDIIITQFAPINSDVIQKATNLKHIGVLRGGIENINKGEAESRGIQVINTPGRNARSVAEFTVGMILSEIRNIARSHASMKQNSWRKDFPNSDHIPELEDRVVGIVGFGNIGQLVGRFLHAFDMRILFYDPYFNGESEFEKVKLDRLLRESDIVTLHGRLTSETEHFIDKDALKKMKPTAVLVNTARSGLVNEDDLIQALKNQEICGAALDVFDNEPLPEGHPFLTLDNVTITSHMAGSTKDAFDNTPKKLASKLLGCWDSN